MSTEKPEVIIPSSKTTTKRNLKQCYKVPLFITVALKETAKLDLKKKTFKNVVFTS